MLSSMYVLLSIDHVVQNEHSLLMCFEISYTYYKLSGFLMRLIFQLMCYTVLIEGKNVIMCQMKCDDSI